MNVILVGNPNVGKSVIFNALTGSYVTVSNYPGTTVDISKGLGRFGNKKFQVIDTPGINSLVVHSEDEKVTKDILSKTDIACVIQIADSKNLKRSLLLTLAIPCSAQLGVIMGMLGSLSIKALLIWLGVILSIMIIVGWCASKIIPGSRTHVSLNTLYLKKSRRAFVLC